MIALSKLKCPSFWGSRSDRDRRETLERKLKNSEFTVQKLKEAMMVALNEKEYDKITIQYIVSLARINRTTFYLFYGSKQELLGEVCDTFLQDFFEGLIEATDAKDDKKEEVLFNEVIAYLRKWHDAIWRLINIRTPEFEACDRIVIAFKRMFLVAAKNANLKNSKDAPVTLFKELYAASIMATIKWWLLEGEKYQNLELLTMIRDIKHKGLSKVIENLTVH